MGLREQHILTKNQQYLSLLQRLTGNALPQSISAGLQAQLKQASSLSHLTPGQFAGNMEALNARLKDPAGMITGEIFRKLLSICTPEQKAILKDTVVGELPTADANAAAIASPFGGAIIVMNIGLADFLFSMTKIMANLVAQPGIARDHDDTQCGELALFTAIKFVHGIVIPLPNLPAGIAFPRAYAALVANATAMAEAFVIAHEIGHILAGHISAHNVKPLRNMRDDTGAQVAAYVKSPQQEYEADDAGLALTLRAYPGETKMTLFSVAWLFAIFHLLERMSGTNSATHPPATLRVDIIRRRKAELSELADPLEHLWRFFDGLANIYERRVAHVVSKVIASGAT